MLGLLMLYWIGKFYYQLAEVHSKSKWGFAVLGLVAYYGSMVVAVLIFVLVCLLFGIEFDFERNETVLGYAAIPFGLLGTYGIYKFLEKNWKREYVNPLAEIDSIGASNE